MFDVIYYYMCKQYAIWFSCHIYDNITIGFMKELQYK